MIWLQTAKDHGDTHWDPSPKVDEGNNGQDIGKHLTRDFVFSRIFLSLYMNLCNMPYVWISYWCYLKIHNKGWKGLGCFCCHCHWYCCCDVFFFSSDDCDRFHISSLGTGCLKTSSAPPMTKLMCRLPGKRLKEMDFRKAFEKKRMKKWIIKIELTCPSWGWAHSRQSCWWTRDSTWVIVQNPWGRKIVGSNVKMCDSCWRDSVGVDLTWQGYSFSRQSWWTGHQEA